MFKNVGSQKIAVFAYDTAAAAPKTGDAANITAQISLDGGATAATDDTNPTELDATDAPGIYIFDLTQAETNADLIILSAASATSDIVLEPVIVYTQTVMRGTDGANTTTPPAAAAIRTEIDSNSTQLSAIKAKTDNLKDTWNDLSAAQVNAEVDTALSDYDAATGTELAAVDAKIDTIDANVDLVLEDTGTTLPSQIGGLNNLSSADVTAAVPTAAAIRAEIDSSSTQLAAILADTGTTVPGLIAALNNIAAADVLAVTVEGSLTLAQSIRLILAVMAGKSTGGGTTEVTFRDTGDTTDRIVATVDADGNRTALTLDAD
ncbi:MAG: hypothetical protein WC551_11220 [Patescibacteria group bacterium]